MILNGWVGWCDEDEVSAGKGIRDGAGLGETVERRARLGKHEAGGVRDGGDVGERNGLRGWGRRLGVVMPVYDCG